MHRHQCAFGLVVLLLVWFHFHLFGCIATDLVALLLFCVVWFGWIAFGLPGLVLLKCYLFGLDVLILVCMVCFGCIAASLPNQTILITLYFMKGSFNKVSTGPLPWETFPYFMFYGTSNKHISNLWQISSIIKSGSWNDAKSKFRWWKTSMETIWILNEPLLRSSSLNFNQPTTVGICWTLLEIFSLGEEGSWYEFSNQFVISWSWTPEHH